LLAAIAVRHVQCPPQPNVSVRDTADRARQTNENEADDFLRSVRQFTSQRQRAERARLSRMQRARQSKRIREIAHVDRSRLLLVLRLNQLGSALVAGNRAAGLARIVVTERDGVQRPGPIVLLELWWTIDAVRKQHFEELDPLTRSAQSPKHGAV